MENIDNGKRVARNIIENIERDCDTASWTEDESQGEWQDEIEWRLAALLDEDEAGLADFGAFMDGICEHGRLIAYGHAHELAVYVDACNQLGEGRTLLY